MNNKNICSNSLGQVKQTTFQWKELGSNPNYCIYLDIVKSEKGLRVFKRIIKDYHSYKNRGDYAGRQINWFIRDIKTDEIYGGIGIGSAIYVLRVRGDFIGWKGLTYPSVCIEKQQNLNKIANNWRFTLMPNIPKNTATKTLSLLHKEAPKEWFKKYGDKLVLLETLVEPPHTGAIYKAAGWIYLGMTLGSATEDCFEWRRHPSGSQKRKEAVKKQSPNKGRAISKLIFVKPLHRYWKRELQRVKDKEEEQKRDMGLNK